VLEQATRILLGIEGNTSVSCIIFTYKYIML
jgi:hypothetical protein